MAVRFRTLSLLGATAALLLGIVGAALTG
jgi:hypothetical protein